MMANRTCGLHHSFYARIRALCSARGNRSILRVRKISHHVERAPISFEKVQTTFCETAGISGELAAAYFENLEFEIVFFFTPPFSDCFAKQTKRANRLSPQEITNFKKIISPVKLFDRFQSIKTYSFI